MSGRDDITALDDTLLSAYLDNELEDAERLAVETALASDPALCQRLELLRQANELAKLQAQEIDSVPLPKSLTNLFETAQDNAGAKVIPFVQRAWNGLNQQSRNLALAAGLVLTVGLLVVLQQENPEPGSLQPTLATYEDLLDSVSSGSQMTRNGYALRPQFSFLDMDQSFCRVFRLETNDWSTDNIACRSLSGWQLRDSVEALPLQNPDNFMPAGSHTALLDELLDAMMSGSPLTLEQEGQLMLEGGPQQ
jgi:hypothetical protein